MQKSDDPFSRRPKTEVFLRDALFSLRKLKKVDDLFFVVILKTQVFTVTILMHKTLYNIFVEQMPSTHFHFFEWGACVRRRGACANTPECEI